MSFVIIQSIMDKEIHFVKSATPDRDGKAERSKPGAIQERLKIDENDWSGAVKKTLQKRRPKDGWPQRDEPKESEQSEPADGDG